MLKLVLILLGLAYLAVFGEMANADGLPPVLWAEDTFIGIEGTMHIEVFESKISSNDDKCVIEDTLEDGPPAEFYAQDVGGAQQRQMGKILLKENGGVEVWITEDKAKDIARDVCFN